MPSIFTRFADIISSNLNAMLDKAENPAKMIKLIIAEMEDTLVEIKAACALAMADQTRSARRLAEAEEKCALWRSRAEMAVTKGRDELAKEALTEKHSAEAALTELRAQDQELASVVAKYRAEIDQLENKLAQAREREQILAHRETGARKSLQASGQIKRYNLTEAQLKLDRLDSRLDKLEAEAELELGSRTRPDAEAEARERAFAALDDSLDRELREIKDRLAAK